MGINITVENGRMWIETTGGGTPACSGHLMQGKCKWQAQIFREAANEIESRLDEVDKEPIPNQIWTI